MSYNQIADMKSMIRKGDFKDNLLRTTQILKPIKLNDNLCIIYKKDKWYYIVSDVATWTKCGNIKTVLFLHLRNKPKGKLKTFRGKEQFMFKFKNKYAIYNVNVYARSSYNKNIITDVGFTKVPNLKECGV